MKLPRARGPISGFAIGLLRGDDTPPPPLVVPADIIRSDDAQLALWILLELHFGSFTEVARECEWDPMVLSVRRELEVHFERQLRDEVRSFDAAAHQDIAAAIFALVESDEAPSTALYLQRHATTEQVRDYLRERSVQQLKESDPYSFVLPRIGGAAKVALAELQYDEYGAGRPDRLHSTMYGDALAAAGLDRTYGAYIDDASAASLAACNAPAIFSLDGRLRGAAMGHLAAFEASSSLPCRRISAGLARVGMPAAAAYFDEHVEADAVHEQVAARDICGALVAEDPGLGDDILFGASACLLLEGEVAQTLARRWGVGERIAS